MLELYAAFLAVSLLSALVIVVRGMAHDAKQEAAFYARLNASRRPSKLADVNPALAAALSNRSN